MYLPTYMQYDTKQFPQQCLLNLGSQRSQCCFNIVLRIHKKEYGSLKFMECYIITNITLLILY